ncbi:zinc dependent phospholipase C family protein [Pedobacter sp.]|uniref:zinc dependent phospholipase C family protein n=1 Tax=Pedobacter sp. TaxID=1411316 RepID=UPI003D7F4805
MKRFILYLLTFTALLTLSSWGFFAHIRINRLAVFTMPAGTSRFFKANIVYLSEHAVDPDKRRYADTAEAARHYLDVELFEKNIDSIPRKWDDALKKYGLKALQENGILPWHIQRNYYQLVSAFKQRDSIKILVYAAALGHYIADAHVPLHTTNNHNGQLSNQVGIHAFWESRLPELFAGQYNYVVGPAVYFDDPLKQAWKIVKDTHRLVDSVLTLEARLNAGFPKQRKYGYSKRNNILQKQYSEAYAKAYHEAMNKMVEKQMRAAIIWTGAYWYAAWVDAGQPVLENLKKAVPSAAEIEEKKKQELKYKQGKIIGRES